MSSITSASTRQQVLDSLVDNASYLEDDSTTKCKAYITALRVWLRRFAFEETRSGSHALRYNTANAEADLREARTWLAARRDSAGAGSYGRTKQLSVEDFRS